ncbi:MAG TPA: hypothetical protein VM899_16700, partial [Rubellimicrobium sp.]|nr:hypothetical protein [Rubellimicrobium sp.]
MARKAGPGDGAGDAPDGRAELSPEESGFVPDARLAEGLGDGIGLRPVDADRAEAEDLSGEGLGPSPSDGRSGGIEAGEVRASTGSVSAAPEDWRLVMSPGADAGPTSRPMEAGALDAEGDRPGAVRSLDASGEREVSSASASDPFLLTTPVRAAEEPEWRSEPSSTVGRSDPSAPPAASSPSRRRGGFGGLLLGGMIAAALGFGAAWLAQDRLGLLATRLPADLEERLAALETRPVPEGSDLQPL